MKIPLNRIVAFAGPYISLAAGGIAAWLVGKANIIGLPGVGEHQHELATGIAAGGVWLLTTGLAHLGQMKWLKGVHIEMAADAQVTAAALAPIAPEKAVDALEGGSIEDEEAETADSDVSDDEELDAPPPDDSNMPIQPSQDE